MRYGNALLTFFFNLDWYEGKIIKEAKQLYIVRFIFKNDYFIFKIRKKNLLNRGIGIDYKIRQVFDRYGEEVI